MAQGPTPKAVPAAVGPAGSSQLDTLLPNPNPPPYEAATRVEAGNEVVDRRTYRSRVNSRFFGAWFWGVIVWMLLSGLLRSYYEILWPRHRHHRNQVELPDSQNKESLEWLNYSLPENTTIGVCLDWNAKDSHDEALPFVGEALVDLPLSSDSLFLFSRGPLAQGILRVTTDSKLASDRVLVNVTMRAIGHWFQHSTKVCMASRGTSHHGVSIFSPLTGPQALPAQKLMLFETTLSFPSGTPRTVNSLEIDMPDTVQKIGNLNEILFGYLDIQTANAPIEVEALRINDGVVETSWAPIKGAFNTSSSLTLRTTMSPISVDIGATSDGNATNIILSTSNFDIHANISLSSNSSPHESKFDVTASTTYGSLDVKFPTQPLGSTLRFSGSSSHAPASVSLDPAYEGSITLRTSQYRPSYILREPMVDPAGRRRRRHVDLKLEDHVLFGDVAWVDGQHDPRGQIVLHTTHSDATVLL